MASSFKLTGTSKVHARLRRMAKEFPREVAAALRREAEMIMADSKENYVPIDQGVLRSSGYVRTASAKPGNISVAMGYGGAASAYALATHEHPSKHSPPSWKGVNVTFHPPGRGPKYLEKPLKAAAVNLAERLSKRLDTVLAEAAK